MNSRKTAVLIVLVAGLIGGRTSYCQVTQEQVLEQNPQLSSLGQRLEDARADGIDLLSPEFFEQAQALYTAALKSSTTDRVQAADEASKQGLTLLDQAEAGAQSSREIFRDVLAARDRAMDTNVPAIFPDRYKTLEVELRSATKMVAQGGRKEADDTLPKLLQGYSELAKLALKKDPVGAANSALDRAEQEGGYDYMAKTMESAENELQQALALEQGEEANYEESARHATRAIWLAERAIHLTRLAEDFEQRGFEIEDQLLWYQQQLDKINAPLGKSLPFDQDNRYVIATLRNGISSLVQNNADLTLKLDQVRSELTRAEQKRKSSPQKPSQETVDLPNDFRKRYKYVQSLFDPSEARIYLLGKNIVIAALGMHFLPGGSEVEAENFPLLKKVVKAIEQFPASNVSVEGHTDWFGDAKDNLKLSQERASNVAQYLVDVGKIDAARVFSKGYGETRPISSNKTEAGRAANRRVEIQILNN